MQWTKEGDGWISRAGEPVVFTARVRPKGDGRWVWEIFKGLTNTMVASGIVSSLGAAKTIATNFVSRSGLV